MINNHWLKKYCTTPHRLGIVICLMLFAVLSGGCINSDAGFIDIPPATQSKYELPVKFYPDQIKMVYCQHVCLNCMQSTSCKMLGWLNQKLEARLPG